MKRTVPAVLTVLFGLMSSDYSLAFDDAKPIGEYLWSSPQKYTLRISKGPDLRAVQHICISIEALEYDSGVFLIAVRAPQWTPGFTLFVRMDALGSVESLRACATNELEESLSPATARSAEHLNYRLGAVLGLQEWWFDVAVWGLPGMECLGGRSGTGVDSRPAWQPCSETDSKDVVCLEANIPASDVGGRKKIVKVFDKSEGMLVECRQQMYMDQYCGAQDMGLSGDALQFSIITRLSSTAPLDSSTLATRLEQHKRSLPLDEFVLKVCVPCLDSEDSWVRRRAMHGMFRIKDKDLMPRVYAILTEAGNTYADTDLWEWRGMSESFLFEHVGKGEHWAIAILLDKKWAPQDDMWRDTRLGCFENLSGLVIESREAMERWFSTVQDVLPRLGASQDEELVVAAEHEDAWVRLFALSELARRDDLTRGGGRNRIDLCPLLENALDDENEEVRELAKWRLEMSRREEQEEQR